MSCSRTAASRAAERTASTAARGAASGTGSRAASATDRTASAATGRAVSAAIVRRLNAALASGRALTYAELAGEARCTPRTVRNYLADAEQSLGLRLERTRGAGGLLRVRAARGSEEQRIEDLGRLLAREMLRRIFPVAGTDLERAPRAGRAQLVVMARGAFEYGEAEFRALRSWLQAAALDPPRPVRFQYDGFASGPGERIVWPLGIVVRDLARVYLAGVPAEAENGRDVRTYCLERVRCPSRGKALVLVAAEDAGHEPRGLHVAAIEDALDFPFSVYAAHGADAVVLRARIAPNQARHLERRRWHRRQRLRRRRDGSLDVTLGPADRGELEAWLRQWGDAVLETRWQRPG
jgi:hypothetical protein